MAFGSDTYLTLIASWSTGVLGHEDIAAEPHTSFFALPGRGQHALKGEVIVGVLEDSLACGGAVTDVISQPAGASPWFAGHGGAS